MPREPVLTIQYHPYPADADRSPANGVDVSRIKRGLPDHPLHLLSNQSADPVEWFWKGHFEVVPDLPPARCSMVVQAFERLRS